MKTLILLGVSSLDQIWYDNKGNLLEYPIIDLFLRGLKCLIKIFLTGDATIGQFVDKMAKFIFLQPEDSRLNIELKVYKNSE